MGQVGEVSRLDKKYERNYHLCCQKTPNTQTWLLQSHVAMPGRDVQWKANESPWMILCVFLVSLQESGSFAMALFKGQLKTDQVFPYPEGMIGPLFFRVLIGPDKGTAVWAVHVYESLTNPLSLFPYQALSEEQQETLRAYVDPVTKFFEVLVVAECVSHLQLFLGRCVGGGQSGFQSAYGSSSLNLYQHGDTAHQTMGYNRTKEEIDWSFILRSWQA